MLAGVAWLSWSWWLHQFETASKPGVIAVVPTQPDSEQPLVVLYFPAETADPELLILEPSTQVELYGGYGQYPIRSVVPVARADQRSDAFIQAAVSMALGRVVDQLWLVDGQTWPLTTISHHQFSSEAAPTQIEWIRWRWWLNQNQLEATPVSALPVSSQVYAWQPELLRQCPVALVNTTPVNGLGGQIGQLLENSGVFVIRVTDTSNAEPTTQLFLNPDSAEACELVVKILERGFGFELQSSFDQRRAAQFRAEAVVLLGEDLAQEF